MYKIYRKLIESDYCDFLYKEIINNAILSDTHKNGWWMWNIWGKVKVSIVSSEENYNENLRKEIINKINTIFNKDDYELLWLQMTRYEKEYYLKNHTDGHENYTLTILLSDNFEGGRTILNNIEMDVKKGDCILFNGFTTQHGVTKVKSGYRAAINLWIKPTNNIIPNLLKSEIKEII